uniref:Tubulin alpha-6 chain n=1 Tax=Zea mays TaxID=4577 RepID=B6SQW3_MAIZE|nr:tubulin alpha-6 chain [Zea mays]
MAMTVIRLAAIRPPSASSSAASPSLWPPARLRLRVRCRAGGDGGMKKEEGEAEAPESLFARELRRRGMAPGAKRGVAATEFERGAAADGQRERSMALNSEGLEGLVPRAKLLLSLGSTFFLAFGPLILVTVSLFAVLYVYFGPSFVHDASKTPVSPPPYIDPYELLEDERLSRPSPDVF